MNINGMSFDAFVSLVSPINSKCTHRWINQVNIDFLVL